MKAKHIPNILSFSRIAVSLAMPFLGRNHMPWFLTCFIVAGLTDVFDGIIARKLKCQSKFGEKIDSLGDGVFIISAILTVIFAVEAIVIPLYCYVIFAVLMVIRVVNMIFTWKKFRRVGFIHTRSTRWASIPIAVLLPITVILGQVPTIPLAIFLSLTAIAQLEETVILHAMQPGEYTMSLKSYRQWKRDRDLSIATEPEKQEAIV